jgi:hypothetical protein
MSNDILADIRAAMETIRNAPARPLPIAIVPPRLAEQTRAIYGAERVIVSEYLPPGKAYVYRSPSWLNDPLAPQ